jgi:tRNA (guanine37-N1)-methyltransferase
LKRSAAKNASSASGVPAESSTNDRVDGEEPVVRESTVQPPPIPSSRRVDHFVMNLPATAIEFLDAFRPAFTSLRTQYGEEVKQIYAIMPMVHVHCFTRELEEDNARKDIIEVSDRETQ